MRKNTEADLWACSQVDEESGCWNWTRPLVDGYGQMQMASVADYPVKAHRLAWAFAKNAGILNPTGTHVHHTCLNRSCVNPDHLVLLSASEHSRLHNGSGCAVHGKDDGYERPREGTWYCRACDRERRREDRKARAVPCRVCGAPRNPGGRGTDTGLCLRCYRKTLSVRHVA